MYTVLVIDDDEGILLLLQTALRRASHEALIANNGVDGIRLAQLNTPHIIILDDTMPVVSGREVCNELRNNPDTCKIPIIISSTSLETRHSNYAENMGADGLLIKPFHPQDLVKLVDHYLTSNKSR